MHETSLSIAAYRRYTIQEVARLVNLNAEYFWQCLRAARDEKFRLGRKIPRSTLAALPLRTWQRQGRKWVIDESSLLEWGSSRHHRACLDDTAGSFDRAGAAPMSQLLRV